MEHDRKYAEVLADLESDLLAPEIRRLRRMFWATVALTGTGTVLGLALVGLAVLPVLFLVLLGGGLALVARAVEPPARPVAGRPGHRSPRSQRQPLGCSTKS